MIYFLNIVGSQVAPYDTPAKGANSWAFLSQNVVFSNGDIVKVVQGTYTETTDNGTVMANISIQSHEDNTVKPIFVINQGVSGNYGFIRSDVFAEAGGTKINISGIEFQQGTYTDLVNGEAIILDGGGTKQDCVFRPNSISLGCFCVASFGQYPTLTNRCLFIDTNLGSSSMGIFNSCKADMTITNCKFIGMANGIDVSPGDDNGRTIVIANNSFYRIRQARSYGDNFAISLRDLYSYTPSIYVLNNIIDGSTEELIDKYGIIIEFTPTICDYNCFYNLSTNSTIPTRPHDLVNANPQWASTTVLTLQSTSPCIGSGATYDDYPVVPLTDFNGNSRPVSESGMGAVEFISSLIPVIIKNPSSATIVAGSSLTLNVIATGIGMTYTWFKDGVAVLGQTGAVFYKAEAISSDAGSYQCVVSNAEGIATSIVAMVTVLGNLDLVKDLNRTHANQVGKIQYFKNGAFRAEIMSYSGS